MFDIKCTDKRHVGRKFHPNAKVRALWNDGILGTSSVQRIAGQYAEICEGCALANQIDDVPEFKKKKSIEERVADLEKP